jgi:Predicted acyltransferase
MSSLFIKVVEYPAELSQAHQIRYQVFQIEQGVDPSLEFDDKEEESQHLLAYLDSKPVGTARMRFLDGHTAKVERVAVLPEARGLGIGKKIMEKTLEILVAQHITEVQIHAQELVRDFYLKMGFEPEGAVFEEAGILHVKMRKLLR